METRKCKNCEKGFTIDDADRAFYGKMAVPPPTWCPECRALRRYAWRNDRNLYRRPCGLCQKNMVSMYSPNKLFTVYCPSCWWGDGWDPLAFGREYDPASPFFEQLGKLQRSVPRIALMGKNSVRSEYTNHSSDNKDCFMGSSLVFCENVLYSDFVFHSRDCVDCSTIATKAERCYQCITVDNSYRCQYCILCNFCAECFYCYDLRGCTDCFLSANLRNKSNYFLNQPYSKDEYRKKVAEFELGSHAEREKLLRRFLALVQRESFHKYAVIEHSTGVLGDCIFDSKNARWAFDAADCEDVKYVASAEETVKDSVDVYRCFQKIELVYESHALIRTYNLKFCNLAYDVAHLEYCDNCFNSQNLFGCIGVKKGGYLILNKRYDKSSYETLRDRIVEDMKQRGEYGEFFPVELSPFGYNESHAVLYGPPMTKEEVCAKGWKWEDRIPGTFGKETMQPEEIPDRIADVGDDIVEKALRCILCRRNYNVVAPELAFYRREAIPIPRECYPCRDKARLALRPPRKLFHRTCMCTRNHSHHEDTCPNEFETPYAPDRPEIVYCESCYQQEIV